MSNGSLSRYARIVNKGISKVEAILKTVMSPTEPAEGYVENYLLLIGDKHTDNFTRLLDLKGVKKPDQGHLVDVFQQRIPHHDGLLNNSNMLPLEVVISPTNSGNNVIPSSITTSLSSMASTAASNFNAANSSYRPNSLSPTQSSPSNEGTRGRLNENFRKLVMTGMAFRKDMQERREHQG